MKTTVTALLAGLIFGLGLLLSGMANPEKVLGFLDIAGAWDPSLALVMAGAIAVSLPAFQLFKGRKESLLKETLQLPTNTHIDRRLVIGGLMFGIGWGLAGFCPGPALVASGAGLEKALIFTLAMLAGMGIFRLSAHKMIPARG
ncbi:YeeE/YedE family protein [Microbulbifer variabilis]|uniref:YeeE/YedE family protein n=1 Tax=Microbulbifer variabilis TaxID=266805 RepID=UPI001CFC7752|nr:YeeE/YedE family protein [Microbulbifer variabilis]